MKIENTMILINLIIFPKLLKIFIFIILISYNLKPKNNFANKIEKYLFKRFYIKTKR